MIQPQQLRVLLAVRDSGSLSRAAETLGYGVPTISHHLGALERHFGVKLVERDRRGTRLTPLGTAFATEAEQILERIEQAERLVTAHRDAGLATLRVGTFASIGSRLLPAAIRELRGRARVQVEVVEAEPIEIVRLLRGGEVHAGLIYDFADDPAFVSPDLELTVLLDEPYQVLVARHSALARLPELDFSELADVDWVSSRDEGEASDRVLRRVCRSVGFDPRVLMRTDDLNMIHGLVAEGLGATLTTAVAVDTRFPVELRATVQELGMRRTSFVRRSGTVPAVVKELQQILIRHTGSAE
ncbi:LysR family transcriptional regulator [Kitasatospora sp. NBC_00374]|uniref:LysR family transcriptional regulator n=1 Tax=Kitasatospora sp. NBC_00374 TaxID=2975964 RepID=UPI0030E57492